MISRWDIMKDISYFWRHDDMKSVVALCEALLFSEPDDKMLHIDLATALLYIGEYETAIKHVDRHLEYLATVPHHPSTEMLSYKLKGDIATKLSETEGKEAYAQLARSSYRRALDLLENRNGAKPEEENALWDPAQKISYHLADQCGELYRGMGKIDRALDCYEYALQHMQNARLYRELGRTLLQAGSRDEAIGALEYALALEPEDQQSCEELLEIYRQKRNTRKRIHYARRVLAFDNENLDLLREMQKGYERLGERRKAAVCARRAKLLERKSGEESIPKVMESFGEARQAA